jgi:FAD-dependent urate hydroxylase
MAPGFLAELGVSLDGVGAPIDCLQQRGSGRRALLQIDVSRTADRFGHPHITLPRRRLLERLFDGLPGEMISFGKACTRIGQRDDQISVEFAGGTSAYGDLLIGRTGVIQR